jgi:outer membrane cobalamin receptor
MGYQLPFIDESSDTLYPNTGFGLKATTDTSYETGLNYHNKVVQFNAALFIMNIDNQIGFMAIPSGGYNYNMAPIRSMGASIDGQEQINSQWQIGANATLMNSKFRSGSYQGSDVPGSSEILGLMRLQYQFDSVWSAYVEQQYDGPQYSQGDNANIAGRIAGYFIYNAALNAEFHDWLFSFRIDNLSNTIYNTSADYAPWIAAPHNSEIAYYPAAGRTAMLQISYRFSR